MTVPPAHQDQTPKLPVHRPRRNEGWALALGAVILLGLFGHLLNQQRASKQTTNPVVESVRPEPAVAPAPTVTARTPRPSAENNVDTAKPSQVAYMVTHKHRLRDCHGTLTFTRDGIRFESDSPEDSFAVGRNDVAVEGDALRIHARTWRFDFHDAVSAESIYQDWKTGTLRSGSAPPRIK